MLSSREVTVNKWSTGHVAEVQDEVAVEVPVALTYNRQAHVVMMVTPDALEDFAVGFSLTEGLLTQLSDLNGIQVLEREGGLEVAREENKLAHFIAPLREAGCRVSIFIAADRAQIEAAHRIGAPVIELHTGAYCDAHHEGRFAERDEIGRAHV